MNLHSREKSRQGSQSTFIQRRKIVMKKMLATLMCAALVGSLVAAPVLAEQNLSGDTTEGIAQFEGLTANEAYDFQIVVKSFQSTY